MKYSGFDPGNEFREQLVKQFGKCQFDEQELTAELFSEIYIYCNDCFKKGGAVDLDQFWSPQLREWLLHGDDCVELQLLSLLEMLPPRLDLIEDYLSQVELTPGKITSTAIRFIDEDCQFESESERPVEELHGTYLYSLVEILLEHGLDPNGIFEGDSIMNALKYVDTGYVAADTMGLLLQNGGDPYLETDGEPLFDDIEFDVIFGSVNQECRDRYDQWVHLWLVMLGHGAKSKPADGTRKEMVQIYKLPYDDGRPPFAVENLKEHREYSWALTHVPGNGENWSLHIIDKATGWEVLRL